MLSPPNETVLQEFSSHDLTRAGIRRPPTAPAWLNSVRIRRGLGRLWRRTPSSFCCPTAADTPDRLTLVRMGGSRRVLFPALFSGNGSSQYFWRGGSPSRDTKGLAKTAGRWKDWENRGRWPIV